MPMNLRAPRAQPPETPRVQMPVAMPPAENVPAGVSQLMISSLPPMASGADVYVRQFYRGSQIPWRRYLPINPQT